MILDMMSKTLGTEGYSVYIADNSQNALGMLEKMPDLILLDINMPGKNGLELCQNSNR